MDNSEENIEIEPNACEKCGKECDVLHGKGIFHGNKNDDMMCEVCYEEVFDELA